MTDQIPQPLVEDMPLGSILPFLKAEDVPDNWQILDGTVLTSTMFPALIAKMHERWENIEGEWADDVRSWWEERGGFVLPFMIRLPDIHPDEVMALAFGATYLADDAEPVLAIKAMREVSSDGQASSVQDPDPDAR